MIITMESGTCKVTIEREDDTAIETLDDFCGLMVAFGFHRESVDEAIEELSKEKKEEKNFNLNFLKN